MGNEKQIRLKVVCDRYPSIAHFPNDHRDGSRCLNERAAEKLALRGEPTARMLLTEMRGDLEYASAFVPDADFEGRILPLIEKTNAYLSTRAPAEEALIDRLGHALLRATIDIDSAVADLQKAGDAIEKLAEGPSEDSERTRRAWFSAREAAKSARASHALALPVEGCAPDARPDETKRLREVIERALSINYIRACVSCDKPTWWRDRSAGGAPRCPSCIAKANGDGVNICPRSLREWLPTPAPDASHEGPSSTWTLPNGEQVELAEWPCPDCKHNHVTALGGICIGCPCERSEPPEPAEQPYREGGEAVTRKKKTVREIRAEAIDGERRRCGAIVDYVASVCQDSGDSTSYAALLFASTQIRGTPRPVSGAAARSAPKKSRRPSQEGSGK